MKFLIKIRVFYFLRELNFTRLATPGSREILVLVNSRLKITATFKICIFCFQMSKHLLVKKVKFCITDIFLEYFGVNKAKKGLEE